MKIRKYNFIFFLSLFSLSSCGYGTWDIAELYAQKIPGTSKLLYKYDAWGGRDSNVSGFQIMDSTETFEIDLKNVLPFTYLSDIPKQNKIQGILSECYNSCGKHYNNAKPIFKTMKITNTIFNDVNVETLTYQYKGFSKRYSGLQTYEFEKFEETKDSLFFYNLNDVVSLNGIHLDKLKLKKGEIYLQENNKNNKELQKIVAEEITVDETSREFIKGATYFLTPKNKTPISKFSEKGIFRSIKIQKSMN